MSSTYSFRGVDQRGERRSGRIVAMDRRTAEVKLHRRGIEVSRLRRRVLPDLFSHDAGFVRPKLPLTEVSWVCRNLASLLRNGVTLPAACELLADQRPGKRAGRALTAIQTDLEAGQDVGEAFGHQGRRLGDVAVSMIEAGAATGTLLPTFTGISSLCDAQVRLRTNLRRAISYPITVAVTTGLLLFGMIYFVVPRFEKLYADLGAPLPSLTTTVLNLSITVTRQAWAIPASIALIVSLVVLIRRLPAGRLILDRLVLKLPRIGPLAYRSITARCVKTLGALLQSRVPMLDALELTGRVAGNAVFEASFTEVRHAIALGDSFSVAFASADQLPLVLRDLAAVGDAAGDVSGVLLRYAADVEEDLKTDGEGFGKALEPFMIGGLGALIGVVMVALYLPMFKLITVIK